MRLDYKKTFLIGFGFFAISVAWPIYNTYVPLILEDLIGEGMLIGNVLIKSGLLIGIIMTFDNIFAVVFQPLFGALSDRTNTRFGRRMPYLIFGIPVSAAFFALIPMASSLLPLMTAIIIMNFAMSVYRAPTVALMPDHIPSENRSKANGVINLMGGIGAVIAFGAGGLLYGINPSYPFYMGSIIMVAALFILLTFVKEPQYPGAESEEVPEEATGEEKRGRLKSLIFILLAIFFWFVAFNGVETFFSLYGVHILGITGGEASLLLMFFSGFFVLFALPAGFIATSFGRKRTIMTGLIGLLALFLVITSVRNIFLIRILLIFGGICWALININSYPMVVEMGTAKGIGASTGYYYFFSSGAAIISPWAFGLIKDLVGTYEPLFIYSSVALVISILCMTQVKHGESTNQKQINQTEVDGAPVSPA